LQVDRQRIYAVGGSMGGQETLLLLAQHPRLLAGAVAVDPMVDFARQYDNFPRLRCSAACRRGWHGPVGLVLQAIARRELGGTPATAPAAYAARSPISYIRAIVTSCVPLELWWSRTDRIVMQSSLQSGLLARRLREARIRGPFEETVGSWRHTTVLRASTFLPAMLAELHLMSSEDTPFPPSLQVAVHVSGAPCGG
jgi:pimeloyl-ACP methyl ester carboxylesterase